MHQKNKLILAALLMGCQSCWYFYGEQSANKNAEPAEASAPSPQVQLTLVKELVLEPYTNMLGTSGKLAKNLETECLARKPEFFHDDLEELFLAWARVEAIDFGGIDAGMGHAKTYFWPDKHGAFKRHMLKFQKTFAENQSTDIEITKLPLTITGLQALEFYFFAGAKDTQWLWSKKSKACKLMQSIAESHQSRMQKTVQFWRDWTPPKDDPEYLLRGLVQATSNHLERISTIKIQKALRQKSELNLEYPWAKLSVRVLQENFSALNLAFTKPDSGIGALLWKKNPKVFANLKSQLSEISEVAGALNPTIASFAASSIAPKAQKLRETFTKKIPGALGVRLGFNAADGD